MNEDRVIDIEIKLTRQEDLVDALNKMVYEQQKKIDELEALCVALAGRLKEIASGGNQIGAAHERPPHY
ncbi:SlyX family protein [Herminiimonas aquatilis]|uniref:SlyX family protein n=1 Tax=Herminiimonas aquatilis TaxID=345342 RepID=A0ABW2J4N5_9BURK